MNSNDKTLPEEMKENVMAGIVGAFLFADKNFDKWMEDFYESSDYRMRNYCK